MEKVWQKNPPALPTLSFTVVLNCYLSHFRKRNSVCVQWLKTESDLKLIFKYVKNCLAEIFYLSPELESDYPAAWVL